MVIYSGWLNFILWVVKVDVKEMSLLPRTIRSLLLQVIMRKVFRLSIMQTEVCGHSRSSQRLRTARYFKSNAFCKTLLHS